MLQESRVVSDDEITWLHIPRSWQSGDQLDAVHTPTELEPSVKSGCESEPGAAGGHAYGYDEEYMVAVALESVYGPRRQQ